MTMDEDVDGFAAEYVLGTLDADERAQADALRLVDAGFAAKVLEWERRLGELNVLVAPVEPPAVVWDRIKAGLESTGQTEHLHLPEVPAPQLRAPAGPSADVIDLTQRMRRWRGLTVITGTLAACFVGLVLAREYRPDVLPPDWRHKPQVVERVVEKPVEIVREVVRDAPRPAQFVASFQKDEQSPAFLMTVDIDKKTVTVRQVAADKLADKTYQLWIATAPGAAPRSLGLVENSEFTVRAALSDYDPAVISNATFGISLEPLGGSPTGAPTGPVIHARLFQTTPPNP
jgi:anti-sigma-K factor RskA